MSPEIGEITNQRWNQIVEPSNASLADHHKRIRCTAHHHSRVRVVAPHAGIAYEALGVRVWRNLMPIG